MAPTRLSARLLEHAAQEGAKVIAIGESFGAAAVCAGGRVAGAVGERIGVGRLTEVVRQRDPGERRALAALHERLPDIYIAWAEANDRIQVVSSDPITEQAVDEWLAAAVWTHSRVRR